MKNERQEIILSIIAEEDVRTQEELMNKLKERGIHATQATLSRDIKQLHLIKEPSGFGGYRYAVSSRKNQINFADKLRNIFSQSVVHVDCAQNMVVIKTLAGLANAAAAALDEMNYSSMVGTLAGDDTVFIVMRDSDSAVEFCQMVRDQLS